MFCHCANGSSQSVSLFISGEVDQLDPTPGSVGYPTADYTSYPDYLQGGGVLFYSAASPMQFLFSHFNRGYTFVSDGMQGDDNWRDTCNIGQGYHCYLAENLEDPLDPGILIGQQDFWIDPELDGSYVHRTYWLYAHTLVLSGVSCFDNYAHLGSVIYLAQIFKQDMGGGNMIFVEKWEGPSSNFWLSGLWSPNPTDTDYGGLARRCGFADAGWSDTENLIWDPGTKTVVIHGSSGPENEPGPPEEETGGSATLILDLACQDNAATPTVDDASVSNNDASFSAGNSEDYSVTDAAGVFTRAFDDTLMDTGGAALVHGTPITWSLGNVLSVGRFIYCDSTSPTYTLWWDGGVAFPVQINGTVFSFQQDDGIGGTTTTSLDLSSIAVGWHHLGWTTDAAGATEVFWDGVSKGTASDSGPVTAYYLSFIPSNVGSLFRGIKAYDGALTGPEWVALAAEGGL
jgi:hypothetical protein